MSHSVCMFTLLVAFSARVSTAATLIDVGHHLLLPNTPNQKIEIYVTGGDQISGAQVYVQIGNDPTSDFDTPIFQFEGESEPPFSYPGPNLSTLLAPGSIFAEPISWGENDASSPDFPGIWMAGTGVVSGTVAAEGLLATLYIDTTGYASGTWPLKMFDTIVAPTSWGDSDVPPPIITDGSITIGIPEPSALELATAAFITCIGFVCLRCWPARSSDTA